MKNVIVLLMAFCLICSCVKSDECKKNCVDIRIKGQVKNMESNIGIPDVPVTIAWNSYRTWFGSPDVTPITKGKTDKFGNYDFLVAIDNSLFDKNYILASIPLDSNFLSFTSTRTDVRSYNITSSGLSNFVFELFPKAILSLKIIHPANSTIKSGQVGYSFREATSSYTHYWSRGNNMQDYLIKFDTRANVFTKIFWAKYDANGIFTEYKDSMICKQNIENVFQITF